MRKNSLALGLLVSLSCVGLFNAEALAKKQIPAEVQQSDEEPEAKVAQYRFLRPEWAVQLTGSFKAFSTNRILGSKQVIWAFFFEAEYMPAILQDAGVLGIGPTFGIYPLDSAVRKNIFSAYSLGGHIRYQARYFVDQPLVPWVAYHYDYWFFKLKDRSNGQFEVYGPSIGLAFLTNLIDRKTARDFYLDSGVLRTYFFGEVRFLEGSSGVVMNLSGKTYTFGMRMEL